MCDGQYEIDSLFTHNYYFHLRYILIPTYQKCILLTPNHFYIPLLPFSHFPLKPLQKIASLTTPFTVPPPLSSLGGQNPKGSSHPPQSPLSVSFITVFSVFSCLKLLFWSVLLILHVSASPDSILNTDYLRLWLHQLWVYSEGFLQSSKMNDQKVLKTLHFAGFP